MIVAQYFFVCFVRFQRALTNSFAELKRMCWLNAFSMLVRNLLYPFQRYGLLGCVACVIFYPILIPLSFVFCFVYSLPIVFVTCHVLRHIWSERTTADVRVAQRSNVRSRSVFNNMIHAFEAETVIKKLKKNQTWSVSPQSHVDKFSQSSSGAICLVILRGTCNRLVVTTPDS
jgi:hypothetical protein